MPAQAHDPADSQRADQPRSVNTRMVHVGGRAGRSRRSIRTHARRQACFCPAGRMAQATGMAQPR
jgi:hypothetical protein